MLERAHRACIDVDVGVELDHADLESARLQHSTQRSGRDTFTERGHHAPGDKNESRLMRRVGHGIGEGGGFRRFYALAGAHSKGPILPMRRKCPWPLPQRAWPAIPDRGPGRPLLRYPLSRPPPPPPPP